MTYRSELWWKCQLHGITQSEALIPEDDLPTLGPGLWYDPMDDGRLVGDRKHQRASENAGRATDVASGAAGLIANASPLGFLQVHPLHCLMTGATTISTETNLTTSLRQRGGRGGEEPKKKRICFANEDQDYKDENEDDVTTSDEMPPTPLPSTANPSLIAAK
ncbi:unnamed protein product [Cyprideis torosa]|uniref:Uncharacterized protein n=1 Tax=Cyprideis torosa TaxID=163714 RepID=A0A7R8WI78_9CRUS|nr:unnamed protein product [Cyprideis torosa]CAG0900394.1 unnamed protein product [Cyprideis torosa]